MRSTVSLLSRIVVGGLAALLLLMAVPSRPAEAKGSRWLANAQPWRGIRGVLDARKQNDPAPRHLLSYWRTESGRKVFDAHAYLHPGGQQEAAAGRSVTLKEGLFSWLDRRWHYYDPLPCHGNSAF